MEGRRKGIRKEEKPPLTFMVIPGDKGKVFTFGLSQEKLRLTLVLAGGVALAAASFLVSYVNLAQEHAELVKFREIKEAQEAQIQNLQAEAEEVREKIQAIDQLDKRVREMVGLEEAKPDGRKGQETPSRGSDSGREVPATLAQELEALAEDLEERTERLSNLEKQVQGKLNYLAAIPSAYPINGSISSDFGPRKSPFGTGRSEFHDGIDIEANYGAAVRSAAAGKVVSARYEGGYGYTVTLDHGYGFVSRYAHLSKMEVKPGQWVERGTVIGRVGNSGRSTGSHLHFTVMVNGKPRNPLEFLGR